MRLLLLPLLLLLTACPAIPTVEEAEPKGVGALFYRYEPGPLLTGGAGSGGIMSGGSLPTGQLVITTVPVGSELPEHPPLVSGFSDITGYGLRIASPYCINACVPNDLGFIGFLFEPKDYGDTIKVEVLEGVPVAGVAVMEITGEDVSRQVPLR